MSNRHRFPIFDTQLSFSSFNFKKVFSFHGGYRMMWVVLFLLKWLLGRTTMDLRTDTTETQNITTLQMYTHTHTHALYEGTTQEYSVMGWGECHGAALQSTGYCFVCVCSCVRLRTSMDCFRTGFCHWYKHIKLRYYSEPCHADDVKLKHTHIYALKRGHGVWAVTQPHQGQNLHTTSCIYDSIVMECV